MPSVETGNPRGRVRCHILLRCNRPILRPDDTAEPPTFWTSCGGQPVMRPSAALGRPSRRQKSRACVRLLSARGYVAGQVEIAYPCALPQLRPAPAQISSAPSLALCVNRSPHPAVLGLSGPSGARPRQEGDPLAATSGPLAIGGAPPAKKGLLTRPPHGISALHPRHSRLSVTAASSTSPFLESSLGSPPGGANDKT
jgi:hypothetical protein